jgi:hypothetical protein
MIKLGAKKPGDQYFIEFDFAQWLTATTIAQAVVTAKDSKGIDVTATLTDSTQQSNTNTAVNVWIKGGASGSFYAILCKVTDSAGEILELDALLPVAAASTLTTLADYIAAIGSLVGGDLPLGEAEKIQAINKAVKRYSLDRIREIAEDETGNGGYDYALDLLESWIEGFSTVKKIEYPITDDLYDNSNILTDDAWMIYLKPSGKVIRLLEDQPAVTETLRITYTTLHLCDDTQCTIPVADAEAVQMLSAAGFCDMLATYYSQDQDSTIKADSVDHKSKSSDYAARAKTYRQQYFNHLGIQEGQVVPASASRAVQPKPSWRSDSLTHPRKFR